jgi:hypothetical protein
MAMGSPTVQTSARGSTIRSMWMMTIFRMDAIHSSIPMVMGSPTVQTSARGSTIRSMWMMTTFRMNAIRSSIPMVMASRTAQTAALTPTVFRLTPPDVRRSFLLIATSSQVPRN